jgi:DNA-binding LacI/PurR family transcriptional regulator
MPFLHKQLHYIFHDGKIVGDQAAQLILRHIEESPVHKQDVEIEVELFGA